MRGRKISIGALTFLCWATGFILTGPVAWLELVSWEQVSVAFNVFFLGGLVAVAVGALLKKVQVHGGIKKNFVEATLFGVVALMFDALLVSAMGLSVAEGHGIFFVAVLFAIYEETHSLGISVLLKAANLPDWFVVAFNVLWFIPMHVFVYQLDLLSSIFLALGRVVMTSALVVTDNADVMYAIHIIWNSINSVLVPFFDYFGSLLRGGSS